MTLGNWIASTPPSSRLWVLPLLTFSYLKVPLFIGNRLIKGGFNPFYWNGVIKGGFNPFFIRTEKINGD